MSFLGELSKRLKTDVGEIARASADPVFAQQLTARNFRREERQEIREADAKKVAEARVREEQQRQLKNRTALQMSLVNKAFDAGRETGDYSGLANILQSDSLMPEIAGFGTALYESNLGRSFDSLLKEQRMANETKRLDNDQTSLLLRTRTIGNDEEQFKQKIALDKARLDYDNSVELARTNQDVTNREALIDSVKASKGIFSETEKDAVTRAMSGADSKQALRVYENYLARYSQKLSDIRRAQAKAAAAGTAGAKPKTINTKDEIQAKQTIPQVIGEEEWNELDEDQQNAFARSASDIARQSADTAKEPFSYHLGAAIEQVSRQGFQFNEGTFNDTATFDASKLRAPGQPAGAPQITPDIEAAMEKFVVDNNIGQGEKFNFTFPDGQTRTMVNE